MNAPDFFNGGSCQQASARSLRLGKSVEEKIDKLERKKLEDLAAWMKRFVLIEMSFHSSALSILTQTFHQLNHFDPELDLEVTLSKKCCQAP